MSEELKPVKCGCGGEAEIIDYWSADYTQTVWYVRCKDCDIASVDYFSEAEAITAWNLAMRRAKVDILPNTSEDKGEMPFCPHCGDELEWE